MDTIPEQSSASFLLEAVQGRVKSHQRGSPLLLGCLHPFL